VAANSAYAQLFRRASNTIPIVFCFSFDPVAEGIVANLARPGGNSSALTVAPAAFWGKVLGLLTEAVPGVRQIGVLSDPTYDSWAMPALEAEARKLAIELRPGHIRTADEFDAAFAAMIDAGAEACTHRSASTIALAWPPLRSNITCRVCLDFERDRKRAAF
jgi:putative ABC transport system substrate-binding protein